MVGLPEAAEPRKPIALVNTVLIRLIERLIQCVQDADSVSNRDVRTALTNQIRSLIHDLPEDRWTTVIHDFVAEEMPDWNATAKFIETFREIVASKRFDVV